MATSKIFIGAEVKGKNGNGTIAQIITKSTGYVLVNWENGKATKEMAFNLTDMEGNALKAKPGKKAPKADTRTPQQKLAQEIISVANYERWNNHSSFECMFNPFYSFIEQLKHVEGFASKVAETIDKQCNPFGFKIANVSEKQAWILACAAVENNIEL